MYKMIIAVAITIFSMTSLAQQATQQTIQPDAKPTDIATIAHNAFANAPGLTEAQKIKLTEIMKDTFTQSQKLKMTMAQYKVDLFDALTNPTKTDKDVNLIKKQIVKLDKQRLDVMFKSLDQVQKIIGKNPKTGEYMKKIMYEHIKVD